MTNRDQHAGNRTEAPVAWLLSGRTESAVLRQAMQLRSHVAEHADLDVADVARTLALRRTRFDWRHAAVGSTPEQLSSELARIADGASVVPVRRAATRKIAFVFPGQGAQWVGMATELMSESPLFASKMSECDDMLSTFVDWSLVDVLADSTALSRVDVVQPVLFSVMVSLAELWRSFGVVPDMVLGHSQGEVAAAVVAGALTTLDGLRIVVERSKVIADCAAAGAMASIHSPVAEVRARLPHDLHVAAVNGPRSVVVAGEPDRIAEFVGHCEVTGVRAKILAVDYASHSPAMDPLCRRLAGRMTVSTPRSSTVAFVSSVTGARLDTSRLVAEYWIANLREQVRFEQAVESASDAGDVLFIECSPHPTLTGSIQDAAAGPQTVESLRRDHGGLEQFLRSLAEAHSHGAQVRWEEVFADGKFVELPTYPFEAGDTRAPSATDCRPTDPWSELDLTVSELADGSTVCSTSIDLSRSDWLREHRILGDTIAPGALFVALASAVGRTQGRPDIEEITFEAPLRLPPDGAVEIQILCEPVEPGSSCRCFAVYSRTVDTERWLRNAHGALDSCRADREPPRPRTVREDNHVVVVGEPYAELAASGYEYGTSFRRLRSVRRGDRMAVAEIDSAEIDLGHDLRSQVTTLDAVLQPALLGSAVPSLPFSLSGVCYHEVSFSRLTATLSLLSSHEYRVEALSERGELVCRIDRVGLLPRPDRFGESGPGARLFHVGRRVLPTRPPDAASGTRPAAIVGRGGARLLTHLTQAGYAARVCDDVRAVPPDCRVAFTTVGSGPDLVSGGLGETAETCAAEQLDLIKAWVTRCETLGEATLVLLKPFRAEDGDELLLSEMASGMFGTAATEHPNLFSVLEIDANPVSWSMIETALSLNVRFLSIENGEIHTRTIEPDHAETDPGKEPISRVLVVGGGSHIAGEVAVRIAQANPAAGFALLGRTGSASPDLRRTRDRLTELGASVEVLTGDVADRTSLRVAIGERHFDTVIHAAGVLADAPLADLSRSQLREVFGPKVAGVLNLHELTARMPVNRFVVFSSMASVLGSVGQGNYASANSFLNAFMRHRNSLGLPGLAVLWGLWRGQRGMTAKLEGADLGRLARMGLSSLSDEAALEVFAEVVDRDGEVVIAELSRTPGFVEKMAGLRAEQSEHPADDTMDAASASARQNHSRHELQTVIEGLARSILGIDDAEPIDERTAFTSLGFDSLKGVELRNFVNRRLGVRLPATAVFDHPNLVALSDFVAEQLSGVAAAESRDEVLDAIRAVKAMSGRAEWSDPAVAEALSDLVGYGPPDAGAAVRGDEAADALEAMTDDELYGFFDRRVGEG